MASLQVSDHDCGGHCQEKSCNLADLLKKCNFRCYRSRSLELLLADVIHDRQDETFLGILKIKEKFIDQSLKNRLLKFATECFFDIGVQILLKNGAEPNGTGFDAETGTGYSIFANLIDHVGPEKAFLMTEDELNWYSNPLANIIQLLVDFGANLEPRYRQLPSVWAMELGTFGNHVTPLHKLAYIALYGWEPVKVILENTPPHGFLIGTDESNKYDVQCSPLSAALYEAMFLDFINFDPNQKKIKKILTYSVIPLLQCGSRVAPDPLEHGPIGRYLPLICCDDALNMELWARKNGAIEVLLNSRLKTGLNVERFQKNLHLNNNSMSNFANVYLLDNESEDERTMVMRDFESRIRSFLPLSLQCLCRIEILKHIVVGLSQRQESIEKLPLPQCLKDFLNFSDLHLVHHHHRKQCDFVC